MPISREDFVDYIAQKIRNNELSIFLGAGASIPLGIPSWKDLMAPLAKTLHLDISKQYDYYSLAQYYANQYGLPDLKRHIGEAIFSFESDDHTLELLLKLSAQTIWTTNFDSSIESILHKNLVRYQVVTNDANLANVSSADATTIYKLNGDCHDLDNIVITMDDWEAYEQTHPTMITFLKKELVSNTFLFYGYSFRDNLIKSALSNIRRFVGDACNMHFSIQRIEDDEDFQYRINDLEVRYRVKTLLVKSYDEVPDILDEIVQKVRKNNVFISGRLGDIDPHVENECCEFCRELSIKLLDAGYNLCTGMGRKIGYFVTGPAIQHLLEKGYKNIDRRLLIRPFDDTMSKEKRTIYRNRLIEGNNAVVFIYGHSEKQERSPGMWEEYQIAKGKRKIIIPVGSTGFESYFIWKDVRANITAYPYLETVIEDLGNMKDPQKIATIVLKILELVNG